MRWTRQRRAVLEALRELLSRGVHPTASDILAIARRRVPEEAEREIRKFAERLALPEKAKAVARA